MALAVSRVFLLHVSHPRDARRDQRLRDNGVPRVRSRDARGQILAPPPIRAGRNECGRTPDSAFALTARSSTAEDAPSTVSAPRLPDGSRPAQGAIGRLQPAERQLPRRPRTQRASFFCLHHILLFDPGGAILPSRPRIIRAAARSGGQGWPRFSGHRRLGLDGREHGGSLPRIGTGERRAVAHATAFRVFSVFSVAPSGTTPCSR